MYFFLSVWYVMIWYGDVIGDTIDQCLFCNPSALATVSQGMRGVKLYSNNSPVLIWMCQLTQLGNGHITDFGQCNGFSLGPLSCWLGD